MSNNNSFSDSISKYYLITNGAFSLLDGLYYSVIDMALDQGRGGVTQNIFKLVRYNCRLRTSAQHANGRDWY